MMDLMNSRKKENRNTIKEYRGEYLKKTTTPKAEVKQYRQEKHKTNTIVELNLEK